jgi:hypothetical protein
MATTPYESASLLLRLYELRREPTMREARNWYAFHFNPVTVDDAVEAMMGPNSPHFRMVTSYWDMAASFVVNGAIDEQMFNDANGEQVGVFAKMEPILADYRARLGNPKYLASLEQVVLRRPGAKEAMATTREWFRARAAAASAVQT